MVCRNRNFFERAGLHTGADIFNEKVYLLLFAKKNPNEANFLQLTRRPLVLPDSGHPDAHRYHPEDRTEYDYADLVCVRGEDLPWDDFDELFVVPNMCMAGGYVFSCCPSERFEYFTRHMPTKDPREKARAPVQARGGRLPRDHRTRLLEEAPWLDEEDLAAILKNERQAPMTTTRKRSAPAERESDSDDDTDSEHSSLDIAAEVVDVAAELAELRAGSRVGDEDEDYFYLQIRGGALTKKYKKVVADSASGRARAGVATLWCTRYKFPRSKTFSFKKYDPEPAKELAREYTRRASFFFKLWFDSDEWVDFVYDQSHIEAYEWHREWLDFMCEVDVDSTTFRMGTAVQELAPKLG